jgi:predicted transcriptional regulator
MAGAVQSAGRLARSEAASPDELPQLSVVSAAVRPGTVLTEVPPVPEGLRSKSLAGARKRTGARFGCAPEKFRVPEEP